MGELRPPSRRPPRVSPQPAFDRSLSFSFLPLSTRRPPTSTPHPVSTPSPLHPSPWPPATRATLRSTISSRSPLRTTSPAAACPPRAVGPSSPRSPPTVRRPSVSRLLSSASDEDASLGLEGAQGTAHVQRTAGVDAKRREKGRECNTHTVGARGFPAFAWP